MSDSAKLHLCYGIVLLILSFLCLTGFVSCIWLLVLIDSRKATALFLALAAFTLVGTILSSVYCVLQLLKASSYIEKE